MSASATVRTEFLEQELLRTEQLLQVLEKEKSALMANDIEALLAITPEKSRLVGLFLTARQQLQRQRAAQGAASDGDSLRKWLQPSPQSGTQPPQNRLASLQQAAQECNLTNGLLIQRLSARNQSALAVLRGPSTPGLYGPSGQGINSSLFGVTKAVPG
jgi:flagellar biosynthesis/type III secretory pathway chaperone